MSQPDFHSFVRPDIRDMAAYTPIVPFEVLSEQLGIAAESIVKLDANENPYGPPPSALAHLRGGQFFHIYPDPEARHLRAALSDYVGVSADRLLLGMGADELIDLVLRVILAPGDVVFDAPPSFGMYPFSTTVNGGVYRTVSRSADFSLDIDALETAIRADPRAKALFVCSPNNPDGSVINDGDLQRLLALPVLIILDEAYVDFAEVDGIKSRMSWVSDYENLVVLRTFSKLAGLAGLRLGYGAFPEWLRAHMFKIKQPYNVNVAAALAGIGALEASDWLAEKVQAIVAERERMVEKLGRFSFLQPFPSHSNFVLFRVVGRDAGQLKQRLATHGVLVRYFAKSGVNNCIRITAGRPTDTDRLIEVLDILEAE